MMRVSLIALFLIAGQVFAVESSAQRNRLIFRGQDEVLTGGGIPNVSAVRISKPPMMGGKLDDACCKKGAARLRIQEAGRSEPGTRSVRGARRVRPGVPLHWYRLPGAESGKYRGAIAWRACRGSRR